MAVELLNHHRELSKREKSEATKNDLSSDNESSAAEEAIRSDSEPEQSSAEMESESQVIENAAAASSRAVSDNEPDNEHESVEDAEDRIYVTDQGMVEEEGGVLYRRQPHQPNPACRICGLQCRSAQGLKEHILCHFKQEFHEAVRSSPPWICPECEEEQKSRASLVRHVAWRHDSFFKITGLCPADYPELCRVKLRSEHIRKYRPRKKGDGIIRDRKKRERIYTSRRTHRYVTSWIILLSLKIKREYEDHRLVAQRLRNAEVFQVSTSGGVSDLRRRNRNLRRVRQKLEEEGHRRQKTYFINDNNLNHVTRGRVKIFKRPGRMKVKRKKTDARKRSSSHDQKRKQVNRKRRSSSVSKDQKHTIGVRSKQNKGTSR